MEAKHMAQREVIVRGRCVCGRVVRIRNAHANAIVRCPGCARLILLSEGDLRFAQTGEGLLPLRVAQREPLEAVPLYSPELTPAPRGSQPGLTGETVELNPEARVATALQGGWGLGGREPTYGRHDAYKLTAAAAEHAARGLYFGGSATTAIALFTLCGMGALCILLTPLIGTLRGRATAMVIVLAAATVLFSISYLWRVLVAAMQGRERVALTPGDFDFVDDLVQPTVFLLVASIWSLGPAAAAWIALGAKVDAWLIFSLAAGGLGIWPALLLLLATRRGGWLPDPLRIAQAIRLVGGLYGLTWIAVVVAAGCWAALLTVQTSTGVRIGFLALGFYAMYNAMRWIGLGAQNRPAHFDTA